MRKILKVKQGCRKFLVLDKLFTTICCLQQFTTVRTRHPPKDFPVPTFSGSSSSNQNQIHIILIMLKCKEPCSSASVRKGGQRSTLVVYQSNKP